MNDQRTPVAIIGAGPFGLSIAAHLRSVGMPFRIFGFPMHRWLYQMPLGMFLKSEGQASCLSEPTGKFTLARFCADNRLPYSDRSLPVPVETFTEYALTFQQRFVPNVERILVSKVERGPDGFRLSMKDGTSLTSRNVVVATGLEDTEKIPPALAGLPRKLVSHSAEHSDLSSFAGRDVTVIGGGQSAIETAALLHEQGARVRLVVRENVLEWNSPPNVARRGLYSRLRYPVSNLGEGIRMWFYCKAPYLFRCLPRDVRISTVHRVLGPAGAWWLRPRIEKAAIEILTGCEVVRAEAADSHLRLLLRGPSQGTSSVETDHVIAATGYEYDIQRLTFLSAELKRVIRTENGRPKVSQHFESSVPGLFFAGMASAYSFGPSMRFIEGASYAAPTIAARLSSGRSYVAAPSNDVARASG